LYMYVLVEVISVCCLSVKTYQHGFKCTLILILVLIQDLNTAAFLI
jgi:hypothetical protein